MIYRVDSRACTLSVWRFLTTKFLGKADAQRWHQDWRLPIGVYFLLVVRRSQDPFFTSWGFIVWTFERMSGSWKSKVSWSSASENLHRKHVTNLNPGQLPLKYLPSCPFSQPNGKRRWNKTGKVATTSPTSSSIELQEAIWKAVCLLNNCPTCLQWQCFKDGSPAVTCYMRRGSACSSPQAA